MAKITSFRNLLAWQSAMELAEAVYRATEGFPKREWFGLGHQMRKSAVSIPSNIAEGHRHKRPAYTHHLRISLGSHGELDTQCELATRLRYITDADRRLLQAMLERTGQLGHGLLRSLDNP